MALGDAESRLFRELENDLGNAAMDDTRYGRYFEGSQRLEQIGLAVPPELRRFETIVNWARTAVESVEERCDVKTLMLPGQDIADAGLQEGWEANNLESESHLLQTESLVYGRSYLSVGANEDDPDHPLMSVESAREMAVRVDPRTRRVVAALRLYGGTEADPQPVYATLYQPDVTLWLERGTGGWVEVGRDQHNLGRVPVVPFLNRRRLGSWLGESEIRDAIPLVDAAARSLTNLQIAAETHSVPQKWVLGMTRGDFVDSSGNPIPAWESYFSAIWANQNPDAKVGQFSASDLSNFHATVNHYASLIAGLYGLPMRYLGQNTANPPSADGIRADEARLVKRAERKMSAWGDQYGRAFALYLRIRDGVWSDGNRIKVEWHDAATPTIAARTDSVQKLTGGAAILSVEGGWDELGWSEARKERERQYMARERSDPLILETTRSLQAESGAGPAVGG